MSYFDNLPITTVRKNVGKCPACSGYLWADVDLAAHVTVPEYGMHEAPTIYARAEAVAMRVTHDCNGRAEE